MKKLLLGGLVFFAAQSFAQNALFIPDTITGPNYTLNLHTDSVQFLPGAITKTLGFNACHYLGPTLIFTKDSTVNITVNNQLTDTTTLHWHGMHVPAKWDGGPHTLILPGTSSYPVFKVMNTASTFWYHPHPDMKTGQQVLKGAAGMIIVRDSAEATLALPRKYGVDDFPIIVQTTQFDTLGQHQIFWRGMEDSTILVNGTTDPYVNMPAQVVRLRLLNAAGERSFNFGFTSNKSFYVIGNDGGLLNKPVSVTRIRLSPGERAEVLLDLTGMNGQTIYLMSYASELAMGIQGGPTMPMSGGPPMNSPLNGIDFNILEIKVGPQTSSPVLTVPSSLVKVTPYAESSASITRTIHFTSISDTVMDGPFFFNDSTFNMNRIDYVIPLNNIEIWKLVNKTMVAHPFHIHDVQFFILDHDTTRPAPEESGQKDVILVPPGDSARFITKFTDFADTVVPYMYHCHILMHEDDGMMAQFIVSDKIPAGVNEVTENNHTLIVYPNPASAEVHLKLQGFDTKELITLNIYNVMGEETYSANVMPGETTVNTSAWTKGVYFVTTTEGNTILHQKFIVE